MEKVRHKLCHFISDYLFGETDADLEVGDYIRIDGNIHQVVFIEGTGIYVRPVRSEKECRWQFKTVAIEKGHRPMLEEIDGEEAYAAGAG